MRVRLRLPELIEQAQPPTSAYAIAKASGGRIKPAALYRLNRLRGHVRYVELGVVEALCEALRVQPNDLFGPDDPPPPKPAARKRAARKRA